MSDDRDRQYREYLQMRNNSKQDTVAFDDSDADYLKNAAYGQSGNNYQSSNKYYNQEEEQIRRQQEKEAYKAARAAETAGKKTKGKKNKNGKPKKKRTGLKVFFIIVLIILILAAGAVGAAYAIMQSVLGNIGHVDVDTNNIGIDSQVDSELSNYRNIAILGIDSRDMTDDSDARSDSIIICSINKKTNEIKMFSVYRDTMLDLGDDVGLDKVTHAYYYGKAERSLYALNRNLDLNIKEVVVVNWKAVADTIDAVGGIDLDIEEAEMNEMNKFIHGTAKKTGLLDEDIDITETGEQHVNGVQAVTYARIRKDALTGDYRRNERMKIVVKKTFDAAIKNVDYEMIKKIATVVMPEIKTNISSEELLEMAKSMNTYKMNDTTTGWPYDVGEWTGDAWYGPPVTLSSNVTKLHENFFNQEGYEPTEDVQNISYNISVKTGLW